MTQFVVDLLDSSNNPIGSGPLQNVISASVTSKLDEAGEISFVVPATDYRAATLIDTAARFRLRLSSGAVHYGIIDKDEVTPTDDQPNRTITGADMLRELQHYSMGWWCFYDSKDLNTIVLPDLVADTPWALGTIDAALGNLYYSFDGDSRLAALLKIANTTGKHFRLGSTFHTFDFGAFGAASTIRFTNVDHALKAQDATTDIAIIGSLQITSDRGPIVNRIIPWGAGQDGGDTNRAKVSLFHLTPGDSRWANIKAKPGVRGVSTTISAITDEYGLVGNGYTVADSSGFYTHPVNQLMWCYDVADLTLGLGYNMVPRTINTGQVIVRGSPVYPTPPAHFPATLISNPQLYIEDATAYAANPREAVCIFTDVTLTDTSDSAFELAASQLYDRAWNYLQYHKIAQVAYAVSVFNCPDSLRVGDTVQIVYRGVVTRDGVTVNWVDLNDTFNVINITRSFNADGSTSATVEISNVAKQPIDSTTTLSDTGAQVGSQAVTVGSVSVSSSGGGGGGSGGGGDPITVSPPLVRTINNIDHGTQVANAVFAGPTTGAAAAPTFRALVPADISSGGSSVFLKLDASNDPVTGALDIKVNDANALRVLTEGTSGVYSFPITDILDTFTSADQGPPPNANWTTPATAEDGLLTYGNRCISASENSDSQAVWSPLSGLVNTEVYCDTVANAGCPGMTVTMFARIQDADDLTAGSYFVSFVDNPLSVYIGIYHSGTLSGTSVDYAWSPGDSLGFLCEDVAGSVRLHAYHKTGLGAYTEIASGGDSVYKYASGKIGLQISEAGNTLADFASVDNFGGGAVPAGVYSRQVFNVDSLTDLTTVYQLSPTVATGNPPFVINSTTLNTNLNADLLDGKHAAAFAPSSGITPAMLALPDTHLIVGNASNVGEDAGANITWDNTAFAEQLTISETDNPSTLMIHGSYLSTGAGSVPNGDGNSFQVIAGEGNGSGAGGGLSFGSGNGGTTGAGGPVLFTGGAGGAGVLGGDVLFRTQSGGAGVGRFGFQQPNVFGYLNFSGLSGSNKTFTFPNVDGTIALLSAQTFAATQTIGPTGVNTGLIVTGGDGGAGSYIAQFNGFGPTAMINILGNGSLRFESGSAASIIGLKTLTISDTVGDNLLRLNVNTYGTWPSSPVLTAISFEQGGVRQSTIFSSNWGASFPGTDMQFQTVDYTSGTLATRMKIDIFGNVALGTNQLGSATWRLTINGSQLFIGASSSQEREMSALVSSWSTSTDATRKARLVGNIYDTSPRTWLQVDTDGSVPTIALGGNTNITGMMRQTDTWHAYGGFQLSTTTIACTLNTWAWITNAGHNLWVAIESSGVTVSGDIFTAVHTGDYTGQVTISITGTNGRDFFIRVFNITTNAQMGYTIGATTTGTPNFTPITLPLYMELTAGDTFRFEIENITDNADPDARSAVYNILYVHD